MPENTLTRALQKLILIPNAILIHAFQLNPTRVIITCCVSCTDKEAYYAVIHA